MRWYKNAQDLSKAEAAFLQSMGDMKFVGETDKDEDEFGPRSMTPSEYRHIDRTLLYQGRIYLPDALLSSWGITSPKDAILQDFETEQTVDIWGLLQDDPDAKQTEAVISISRSGDYYDVEIIVQIYGTHWYEKGDPNA